MRLTDLKIPNFKFPKIRMKGIEKEELLECDSSIVASRNFWFYMFNYGI